MLEDPSKFKFLENKSGEKKEHIVMNLPDKDLFRWEALQQKINENDIKKEKFSKNRKELMNKSRSISVEPKIISKLAPESVREQIFEKLLIADNPMYQERKISFPKTTKSKNVPAQLKQETQGWKFLSKFDFCKDIFEN